ncbi:MAG: hypothetical protein LBU32_17875 [Clostridiales bacterium]|nr:hypothetical protein [Clostridiales bacterium]
MRERSSKQRKALRPLILHPPLGEMKKIPMASVAFDIAIYKGNISIAKDKKVLDKSILTWKYTDLQSNVSILELDYPLSGAKCRYRHFALAV